MKRSFDRLLSSLDASDPLIEGACRAYSAVCEAYSPVQLTVPDSLHMSPALWDWKGITHVVPTGGSVDGNDCSGKPYVYPYQGAPNMTDPKDAMKRSNWVAPVFKKHQAVTSVPIKALMERAKLHIKQPVEMSCPDMTSPQRYGTLTARAGYNVPNSTYVGSTTSTGGSTGGASTEG